MTRDYGIRTCIGCLAPTLTLLDKHPVDRSVQLLIISNLHSVQVQLLLPTYIGYLLRQPAMMLLMVIWPPKCRSSIKLFRLEIKDRRSCRFLGGCNCLKLFLRTISMILRNFV